ncbi:uncharacterized protein FIBRA_07209 [Fibroporia radiculosa]|uniref:Xylanolytic transcriptional activator regulatory domain-containing protein n=1 Tax=Fibroporia radiculosa TaxID=599839 RepID=J4GUI6_9APHY|nr:uncharacterized protein FIBRA_07209 [Fibroporia radiculosa]CCM05010.1 predicted protein [Fibroporia radiculosa]
MSSKDARARGIISDLRRDALAQQILDGVDSGPFGASGRLRRSVDPNQDNFFASIVSAAPPKLTSDRSRRQSRITRESVTQDDPSVNRRPTLEWQDRLSESLARWSEEQPRTNPVQNNQSHTAIQPQFEAPIVDRTSQEPVRRKRRVDVQPSVTDPHWDELHIMNDTDKDELDDCADAFGNLSIDENREVRYHGNSCGLFMLARDQRWDRRNVGGVWNFPMAKLWSGVQSAEERTNMEDVESRIPLPHQQLQDHLLERYFTYVNPIFPVIDRAAFMEDYNAQKFGVRSTVDISAPPQTLQRERMQKISKLLLFSMFAFAAHYSDLEENPVRPGHEWDIGAEYAVKARRILDCVYQESRISTCQALILLGIREFGIGMALRMALDLGLNRNSDSWRHDGRDLFTLKEKRIRRQIWWACCLADKYASQFLGRPMAIHESDSAALLPDVKEDDAEALLSSCFHAAASLSVIHGEVIEKIYPVTRVSTVPRRALMNEIHARLLQWSINLPESLQYSSTSNRACPPPYVLYLHCQYWGVMLLLHRPFIPRRFGSQIAPGSSATDPDPIPWKSLDICQGAASHISAFATLYDQSYDLQWGPPFMTTILQSAGIMHILTLTQRPSDPQSTLGLRDCIAACDRMRTRWPSAARLVDLLRGARVNTEMAPRTSADRTRKRPAEDPLSNDISSVPQWENNRMAPSMTSSMAPNMTPNMAPINTYEAPLQPQSMAFAPVHAPLEGPNPYGAYLADLASSIPGMEVSFPVAPGYDWWPLLPASSNVPVVPLAPSNHDPYLTMPSQSFTFGERHYSPDFLQAMRDPVLHFPSAHHPQ